MLTDGTRILLRHIRHEDLEALREGFAHLSLLSRYHRFNGVVRELSEAMLHFFVDVDGVDHVALVATTHPDDGEPHGLGVARFIREPKDPSAAEFAITVVDEAQHKGLGSILGKALARAASARGVRHFQGIIAQDNRPIHRLLAELGPLHEDVEGPECIFDVALASPSA